MEGLGWREVFRRPAGATIGVTPSMGSHDDPPHPTVVQARNDRAAILRLVAELPRAERERLGELAARMDEAVARVEELSRSLAEAAEERDDRRAAQVGKALTAAAMPLGTLLAFVREHRRGGLPDDMEEWRTVVAGLSQPGGDPPQPR